MPSVGKYYIVDAGYPNIPGFLASFRGQRLEVEKDELFEEGERESMREFDDTEATSTNSNNEQIAFDMSQIAEMA
ncbi:hypothetical protein REPUB_Repub14bG0062800 [Reevesia pubescens]